MARRLKPKQYKAALMVAEGCADPQIISELKLRRNTLHRWRRLPEFFELVMHHVENTQQAASYKLGMMQYISITALRDDIYWNRDPKRLKQVMELVEYCRTLAADVKQQGTKEFLNAPSSAEVVLQSTIRDFRER